MGSGSDSKSIKGKIVVFTSLLPLVIVAVWLMYSFAKPKLNEQTVSNTEIVSDTSKEEISEDFIKAVMPIIDSADNYIMISDPRDHNIALDAQAGSGRRKVFSGRRINIAVIGVDSRLGTRTKHADANHVISLLPENGKIEIYSVPRDTYADCGFDDSTGQNKLTVMRAVKGRAEYLTQLAEIVKLDRIHYYVEFGFSQAMGLIEFMGYSDSPNTLQVLRSRQGLGGDDFQRVYNQAQFMKQSIIRQFDRFDGTIGSLMLRGILSFVETNLNYSQASKLYDDFKNAGFPNCPSDISLYVRPAMPIKFKVYDFTDEQTIASLRKKIENFNKSRQEKNNDSLDTENSLVPARNATSILKSAIARAARDTAKNPTAAINTLRVLFEQRAWYQVKNPEMRIKLRNEISDIMVYSYRKRKQFERADNVLRIIETENNLFNRNKIDTNSQKNTQVQFEN